MAPSWLTGCVSTFSRRANTTGPSKPAYGAGTDRRSATTSPVMLVGMIQELGNVFGLELAEDRMVQGAGGAKLVVLAMNSASRTDGEDSASTP